MSFTLLLVLRTKGDATRKIYNTPWNDKRFEDRKRRVFGITTAKKICTPILEKNGKNLKAVNIFY